MAVDRIGIGPVGLHRHAGKAQFRHQSAGDLRSRVVELASAMGRLTDHHQRLAPRRLDDRIEVPRLVGQRHGFFFHGANQNGISFGHDQLLCGTG